MKSEDLFQKKKLKNVSPAAVMIGALSVYANTSLLRQPYIAHVVSYSIFTIRYRENEIDLVIKYIYTDFVVWKIGCILVQQRCMMQIFKL